MQKQENKNSALAFILSSYYYYVRDAERNVRLVKKVLSFEKMKIYKLVPEVMV